MNDLVSIITVVYNGKTDLEKTILSVINQTYSKFEFIIIDGGSTDGTINIIKKYEDKITYWISEPDKGIYDAMNKGILAAKGNWFNFLNAGDSYIDPKILTKVFINEVGNKTLIYGDIKVVLESGRTRYHKAKALENDHSLIHGMKVCHQAIFYHKNILEPYDSTLKLKAEWKHLVQMTRKSNFEPLKLEFPIVYYQVGGLGAQNYNQNRKEYQKVFLELYGRRKFYRNFLHFAKGEIRGLAKDFLKKIR